MLVFRAGIKKMLIRIANMDLGLQCLSWPYWQATSVRSFRIFNVLPQYIYKVKMPLNF